ncbi:MAG: hypothetical protein WCJ89_03850 [Actinomycetes bacterium]
MNIRSRGKLVSLLALVIVISSYALGVRISHPHDGLSNGLGSAQSGLVLFKINSDSTAGSKVIVEFDKPHATPVLGVIAGNEKNFVTLQTGTKLEAVKLSQIRGHLLLVIPFLGSVVNLFGL